ncbi:hypothetical protein EON82_05800 [bacterium]|nr:MAG: hypothetical protein EON82_05800 [bacterium]
MVYPFEHASVGLSERVQPVRAFTSFQEIVRRFTGQKTVTVATGTTCAYLGDERNLREFLVADEAVKMLREAGHLVHFLLFDDSLDALNFRQLRVAVNKDPELIARLANECGKPISDIRDPWGCHESFAAHFETEFMARLSHLGCHPTLISTSRLYDHGAYRPYVETVLLQHDEIIRFLRSEFPNYNPQKLFFPICPSCGYIDSTEILMTGPEVLFACSRCAKSFEVSSDRIRGKLSWKLDCAAKWSMYEVDTEPFSLAYLEPREGSYVVARALGREFFGARPATPIRYGLVTMPKELGGKLLQALPAESLRALMVDRWKTELDITADRVRLEASRHEVLPGVTFADAVKQLVPTWLLKPADLTPAQREIVSAGTAFAKNFGTSPIEVRFPSRELVAAERPDLLIKAGGLLALVAQLRKEAGADYEAFDVPVKALLEGLGDDSKAVIACVRRLVGQEKGLPTRKMLFHLPADYVDLIGHIAELAGRQNMPTQALVSLPADTCTAVRSSAVL